MDADSGQVEARYRKFFKKKGKNRKSSALIRATEAQFTSRYRKKAFQFLGKMNYVSRPIVKLDRLFFGKGLNSARDQRMYRKCSLKMGHRAGRSAAIIAARVYLNKKRVHFKPPEGETSIFF